MTYTVAHDVAQSRFHATVEGHLCVLDYQLHDQVMHIEHTIVPAAAGGRGVAAELTRVALETARQEGWKVHPVCSYADAYMRKHPDTADLRV